MRPTRSLGLEDNWKIKVQLLGKEGNLLGYLVSATFSHHDGP